MDLLEQCQKWCEHEEHEKIIDVLEAIPEEERTPEMDSELARAYNNIAEAEDRELYKKALHLLLPHEEYFKGDHRWNFRVGYAYFYLNQEGRALPYFKAALEARPGDGDTEEMIEACRARISLPCFRESFRERTWCAWQEFARQEADIRRILDEDKEHERGAEAIEKCGRILETAFDGIAFEMGFNGEKHELILTPEGDKVNLFELVYFADRAPQKVLERWNILVGRQPMPDVGLRAGRYEISGEDVQVQAEKLDESSVGLKLYCAKLMPLLEKDENRAWWMVSNLTDQVLGEISAMRYIDRFDLSKEPLEGESCSLTKLPEALENMGLELSADPQKCLDSYTGYSTEPDKDPEADWRLDVIAGSTNCVPLLNDYLNGESYYVDSLHADGAAAGFFCYPIHTLKEENSSDRIFAFRDQLEACLEKECGADLLTLTGGATGLYCGYVDFIAWDLRPVLNAAQKFFKESGLPWANFHSFRRDAVTIPLVSEEEEQEEGLPEDFIPYDPQNPEPFYDKIEEWNDDDRYSVCIRALDTIHEQDWNYRAAYALARALENYAILGDGQDGCAEDESAACLERALSVLENVREEGKDKAEWNMRMAYAYQYLEEYDEAIPYAERWQKLDPEDDDAASVLDECEESAAEEKEERLRQELAYPALTAAFDALNQRGITALACTGYTQKETLEDCIEEAHERMDAGETVLGCCFYTVQDAERFAESGDGLLCLGFGRFTEKDEPTDEQTEEIGGIICEELAKAGLDFQWDRSAGSRIILKLDKNAPREEADTVAYDPDDPEPFFAQLEKWTDADEYTSCIRALDAIPEELRDYRTAYALARALENYAIIGDRDAGTPMGKGDKALLRAIRVLKSVEEEGADKAEWNMRMAYAYQYFLGKEEKAIPYARRWQELDPEDENAAAVIEECMENIKERGADDAENETAAGDEEPSAEDGGEDGGARGAFTGFVLLSKGKWDKKQLINDLKEKWDIEAVEDKDDPDYALVFEYGDMLAAVSLLNGRIPKGEAEANAENNYMWPEAVQAAKAHKAHIMVAVISKGEDDLLERGKLYTKIMAACCRQQYALGVYTSGVVFEPRFYEGFADMMRDGELPVFNWIWFGLYRSEKSVSGYTYGMDVFGKDEIEVLDTAADPSELRDFMAGIVTYVLHEDAALQDGETIGFSEEDKHKITRSEGVALPGMTLKISYEADAAGTEDDEEDDDAEENDIYEYEDSGEEMDMDDVAWHIESIEEKGLRVDEIAAYNHMAIYLRWCMENNLMGRNFMERYGQLAEQVKADPASADLREFIRDELDGVLFTGMFKEQGAAFARYYYGSSDYPYYPSDIDCYAVKYIGEERNYSDEIQDEAYLFVPYDEKYYRDMAGLISSRFENWKGQKFGKKDREPSALAKAMVKYLDCECVYFPPMADDDPIMSAYAYARRDAAHEGFIPMLVNVDETLWECLMLNSDPESEDAEDYAFNPQAVAEYRQRMLAAPVKDGAAVLAELTGKRREEAEEDELDWEELFGEMEGGYSDCRFSAYWNRSNKMTCPLILAKIPVKNPWEVFAYLPFGDWNECPGTEDLMAVAKYWFEKYGAVPAAMTHDELQFDLPQPVPAQEAMKLAGEQYGFCPDMDQNFEELGMLADTLRQSDKWYFWWD